MKTVSKILKHRVQKLKDPEKVAQVYIMSDIPSTKHNNKTTRASDDHTVQQSEIGYSKVDTQASSHFNKEVMRSIINGKMKTNRTFLELKIFPNNINNRNVPNGAFEQRVL